MVTIFVIIIFSIAYLVAIPPGYASCSQLLSSHMTEQEDEAAYLRQNPEAVLMRHLLAGCPDTESQSLLQLQRLAQHPGPLPHHQRRLLVDAQQG